MNFKKLLTSNWFIASLITLLFLAAMLVNSAPLQNAENMLYDRLIVRRNLPKAAPVVLIAIDRESIRQIGSWPWSRSKIAKAINIIQAAKAKTIGLDLLYAARETNDGLLAIKKLRADFKKKTRGAGKKGAELNRALSAAERQVDNDTHLIKAVAAATNIILPLHFLIGPARNIAPLPQWLEKQAIGMIADSGKTQKVSVPLASPFAGDISVPPTINFIDYPFLDLAAKSAALGHNNFIPDADGIVRSDALLLSFQDRLFPSMALQLALRYGGTSFKKLTATYTNSGIVNLTAAKINIAVSSGNLLRLDFNSQTPPYKIIPFHQLLSGKIGKKELAGKIVIIGLSAPELTQYQQVADGNRLAEAELIATASANIVSANQIFRPDWAWAMEIAALLYFGLFLIFIIPRVNIALGASILAIFILIWQGATIALFINYGLWIKSTAPTILAITGFALLFISRKFFGHEPNNEHIESNKMLGLSLQGQGLFDMAFEKFMKCPVKDPAVKDLLYNLGLDFERKRMFNKAAAVYKHILTAGNFKDIRTRIDKLNRAEVMPLSMGGAGDTTLSMDKSFSTPTLGRYEVIKELGQGAIGTVYLGRDPKINREVAIKTLRCNEVDQEDLQEVKDRFFREAEAAGKLSHPNIITVYDIGEDNDITYMAMEYLTGGDLSTHCRIGNLLPTKKVVEVIMKVADALDYAHKNHVVHRDIKPANIILQDSGQVTVADFGIARILTSSNTQTGVVLGTPNYMSPEQVAGRKVDGQSDIFSLGIVFYELLTGTKPFQHENVATLMHHISTAAYTPIDKAAPETPECCVEIVHKMMAKAKTRRYKTAGEITIALGECLNNLRGKRPY